MVAASPTSLATIALPAARYSQIFSGLLQRTCGVSAKQATTTSAAAR